MTPTEAWYTLDEAVLEMTAAYLDAHPLTLMHERAVKMVTDEIGLDVYAYALALGCEEFDQATQDDATQDDATQDQATQDDATQDEAFYAFVHDRVNVFVTTIAGRAYPEAVPTSPPTPTPALLAHLADLRAQPQPEQRTPAWYEFRRHLLTASEIAKLLTSEASRNRLIFEKCAPPKPADLEGHVSTASPRHWGQKYEPVTAMLYTQRTGAPLAEFGCLRHPTIPCIGASPDGIVVDPASPLCGRMVEIKNIVNRDITGVPLTAYWVQMQIQMEVCDLEECDFVETRFKEYAAWEEAFGAEEAGKTRGMLLQCGGAGQVPHYVYMPAWSEAKEEEVARWIRSASEEQAARGFVVQTVTAWYLDEWSRVVVPRQRAWFAAARPLIEETWATVVRERVEGYAHREAKKRSPGLLINVVKLE